MQFKALLMIAPFIAFVAAAPGPQITPKPVVAKRGDPLSDITSAIDNGVDKVTSGVEDAFHYGSSVLSNGVTVLTDGAGKAYTLASEGAGSLVTLGGTAYNVATNEAGALETSVADKIKDHNAAPSSYSYSPLVVPASAALFGFVYGARMLL